jgi:hypothetical protein
MGTEELLNELEATSEKLDKFESNLKDSTNKVGNTLIGRFFKRVWYWFIKAVQAMLIFLVVINVIYWLFVV